MAACTGDGKSTAVTWGETFKGINGKLVAVATSLFFIQQFSGINAIVYFSSSVFRDAGIPSEALASASVGLINVLGTIVAASLMDKQGRKYGSSFFVFVDFRCREECNKNIATNPSNHNVVVNAGNY